MRYPSTYFTSRRAAVVCAGVVTMLMAGCASESKSPVAASSPAPSARPAASAAAGPVRNGSVSRAGSVDDYKRDAAQRILDANRDQVMEGRPQALLRAVIVAKVRVQADGQAKAEILRSPDPALSAHLMQTLRTANPLPAPPAALVAQLERQGYTETWLYNTDGRFQLRTLAPAQRSE